MGNTDNGWAPQHDLLVPNAALRAPINYNGLADDKCVSENKINLKIMSADGTKEITTLSDVKDCVSIDYIKQLIQNIRSTFRYQMMLCLDPSCYGTPAGLGRAGTTIDKGARGK